MPYARIVAESPERARIVARQLEARGYTVEVVAPGAPADSSADLEITVTADSALPFVADEVFAAPGSILGLMEYEPGEKPAPEYYVLDDQPPSASNSIREALAQTRQAFVEAWQSVVAPLKGPLARFRTLRTQRSAAMRVAREERRAESARLRAEHEEAQRRARVAEQERERRRADQAESARLAGIEAERQRERVRVEREEATRLARIAQEQEAARRRAEASDAGRLAQISAEKERARRRALELEQQRAARAAAEQQEAQRLAGYEQSLVARRRAEEKRRREEFLVAEVRRREAEERAAASSRIPPLRLKGPERRWRAAFAGAASVSALAVLALFFSPAQRKPAAPVSNQSRVESQAVEQQIPFGAATAPPAETVLKKAATPAPSINDAPKPRPQPRRVFRADSDQYLGEDDTEVVIRRKTARPPRAGEQASRVKRITDEEMEDSEEEEFE